MNRPSFRTVAALAAGVLLLAPLAGCGGGDKKPAAKAPTSAAAPVGTPVAKGEFFSQLLAAMNGKNAVHMKIDGGPTLSAEGDLAYGGKSPLIQLTASFTGAPQQVIIAKNAMYMQQSAGGKYVKVGANDPTFGTLVASFNDFDPRSSVNGIQDGVTKVSKIGPAKVGDIDVIRYDVTADTSKLSGALKSFAGSGSTSSKITLQFLVGADQLLRQIKFESNGQPLTITFSDWGKPVTIKVPTGAQLLNSGN